MVIKNREWKKESIAVDLHDKKESIFSVLSVRLSCPSNQTRSEESSARCSGFSLECMTALQFRYIRSSSMHHSMNIRVGGLSDGNF